MADNKSTPASGRRSAAGGSQIRRRRVADPPQVGWRWDHWEGSLDGADPEDASLELPMDQARTITAVFIERATLTIVKELIGNLPADGGTVSPGEGEHEYDKGEEVDLTATAASGWRFKQWSGGGASGDDSPITITMSGDKTVTATFIQRHTVTTTALHGEVTPTGGTWDHGQSVSFKWEKEAAISFFQFTHWSGLPDSFTTTEWGPGTSDQKTISVPINDNYHLIAHDEPIGVLLTAEVDADGCTGCTVDPALPTGYLRDTEATVTATPGAGWGFVRWEGNVPEEDLHTNPLPLLMDEDKEVTAVFIEQEYILITSQVGLGTVDPEPGVEHIYLDGDTASIGATPAADWKFDHWSGLSEANYPDGPAGPGTSAANPLSLAMHQDENLTANFVAECKLVLEETGLSQDIPTFVKKGSEAIEELGKTVFGDFKFKIGGNYAESPGECQNPDGTKATAVEKTGTATFEFEKTDIPLVWGITTYSEVRIMGRKYKIKFTGGLRGDIGVFIEGTYSVLEYGCPCLDEEYCKSGLGIYSLTGGIAGAVDIGTRLVVGTQTFPFGEEVEVELCNTSLANIAMSGRMGIEQSREGGCNPKDCIVAHIDPIHFTVGVAIAGFNCTAIDMQYPKDGQKLWEIYEGCENPG